MEKKVTMQDIADRLNISKNSVSQALSESRELVKIPEGLYKILPMN